MARDKGKAGTGNWKELVGGEEDFLRGVVRAVVQEVLEAEMEETLQARKGERTSARFGLIAAATTGAA